MRCAVSRRHALCVCVLCARAVLTAPPRRALPTRQRDAAVRRADEAQRQLQQQATGAEQRVAAAERARQQAEKEMARLHAEVPRARPRLYVRRCALTACARRRSARRSERTSCSCASTRCAAPRRLSAARTHSRSRDGAQLREQLAEKSRQLRAKELSTSHDGAELSELKALLDAPLSPSTVQISPAAPPRCSAACARPRAAPAVPYIPLLTS